MWCSWIIHNSKVDLKLQLLINADIELHVPRLKATQFPTKEGNKKCIEKFGWRTYVEEAIWKEEIESGESWVEAVRSR